MISYVFHLNGGEVIQWCSKGNKSRLLTCNFFSKYLSGEKDEEEETEVHISDDSSSEEEDDLINPVIIPLATKPKKLQDVGKTLFISYNCKERYSKSRRVKQKMVIRILINFENFEVQLLLVY